MAARVYPGLLLFATVVLGGFGLGVVWCIFLAMRYVAWSKARAPRRTWRGVLLWGVCPATGLLLTVLYVTQVPLVLRVKLSETAMLELVEGAETAARAEEGSPQVAWPVRAGAMWVQYADVQERCVFLLTNHGFIFHMYGLVYVKGGGRPEGNYMGFRTGYRHLVGDWWTFVASD